MPPWTSIGISREQRRRLFKAFSQADSSITRRFGGTGLGLVIAKHLVGLMEGSLEVESEEGKGTTFVATLWIDRQEGAGSRTRGELLAGRRIAVYDPNPLTRRHHAQELARWGADSEALPSLPELAEGLTREPRPELALVGIDESRGLTHGFNAVLSALPREGDVPLAVMVGTTELEQQRALERMGAAMAISKMEPAAVLVRELDQLLRGDRRPHSSEPEQDGQRFAGLRVLVVDDNPINLTLAATLLRQSGVEVREAESGAEALARAEQEPFDLILMDVQMPEMSGIETTRRLHRLETGRPVPPIVALTAHAFPSQRQQFFAAGMCDCLTKPFSPEKLYEVMDRWVGAESPPPQDIDEQELERTAREQEQAMAEESADLPAYDRHEAVSIAGGDEQLARTVLEHVLGTLPEVVRRMRAAAAEEDMDQLRYLAHKLRGSASSCSAKALVAAAATLERVLTVESTSPPGEEQIEGMLERIETQCERLLDYF